ncbi:hypothetical protein GGP41_003474 [Bipolaris sorokiniana]|uniref:Uncharacterized protein n=1 Tax=Cochliobolus sativus TaxID=45130 RepID=A0A8H5ZBK5_COCSA|nr:hypothetical protein GGP41_003474 [Bipolaris sorokiniana]
MSIIRYRNLLLTPLSTNHICIFGGSTKIYHLLYVKKSKCFFTSNQGKATRVASEVQTTRLVRTPLPRPRMFRDVLVLAPQKSPAFVTRHLDRLQISRDMNLVCQPLWDSPAIVQHRYSWVIFLELCHCHMT